MFLDDIVGRMSVEEARMSGADKWRKHFDRETAPARAEFNKSTEHYNRLKTDPAYKEQQFKAWQEKIHGKKDVAEGEHDAEFIGHEDSFYRMADFAHKQMKKGQSLQDVIQYLRDNNYLEPQEVNSFVKQVRGEKWNESVAENYEDDDAEGESEIQNGSYVTDTQDSTGEVYLVSQYEPGARRCWIGDQDGRGWYISPDRLEMCNDPRKINQYFGKKEYDEDSWSSEKSVGTGDAWSGQSHEMVEAGRMSAAVKLQRAWEREQSKSTASRERADQAKAAFEREWQAKQQKEKQGVAEDQDYMAGHCHVMAIALKMLHPAWQIRAHVGWEDDTAEDDEYRVDHVYIVAPDGSAYDCRGRFDSEEALVGEDVTGGFETQYADFDLADIQQLVQRGELKRFTREDINKAVAFAKRIHSATRGLKGQGVTEGQYEIHHLDPEGRRKAIYHHGKGYTDDVVRKDTQYHQERNPRDTFRVFKDKQPFDWQGVAEAGEWPDKMSHDDLENMQRNHQQWLEKDTPSRTDPSATVEDFYHEVVRLGPGLGRDLLYFAAEEGDEPPHIVKAARQLYKKIARKAGLNPEIGGSDNNEIFDLMYDWVEKNYNNPGKQGVAEDEGDAEGLPHLTRELLTHIVQQVGKEGAHAIVKSLEWGDGAARELLHLIVTDLKNNIEPNLDEHIGKVKGGFRLYSHKGKNLGTFPRKGGAEKHEREVQYFKHADESADQLNELDLLAPRSTYFKMGDGAWIKADYRGTQGLTGHTSNDATAFSSFEWVPPQTASSLGLEKKLTEPSTSGQSDPNQLVPDTNIQGNGPMGTRSSNVVDFTTAKSDAIPASLKSKLVNWVHANPQQGVTEQLNDASPVTGAITRRILSQRLDLLKQYGPELVGAAVDNVADYVGDVEEIGSSDVSAWVQQVERMLRDNPPEAFAEGFQDFNKVEPYAVCLAGKPVKKFDYYEQARKFHDNWKQKLYREGDKAKADTITLMPLNLDEAYSKTPASLEVLRDLATQWQDGSDIAYDELSQLGWNISDDRKGVYIIKQSDMSGRSKIYFPELTAEAYTPSPAKPFRNPRGFNKQGTGVGNKLAQQNRAELNQWRMGMSMAGEKEPTQSKGTPVPANAFAQGVLKDLKKVNVKEQGVAEGVYGRNKGYTQGFASPNAPSLGGNNYDSDGNQLGGGHDEYHVPDPVDTATWFIRINGKLLKDRNGSPYHFRGREAANKAALTMMKKPFNAGKKFTLTTSHSDDQSLSESYWAKLQNERSTKLNNLVNELKENIK